MVSISGFRSHFCPLDDEGGDAVDDGVSAIAGIAEETRIFKAEISVAGWAGEVGEDRCVEFEWGRGHGVFRLRFRVLVSGSSYAPCGGWLWLCNLFPRLAPGATVVRPLRGLWVPVSIE